MGLLKVGKIEKRRSHEEIFLDHYDWLLKSARELSHGSKLEGEDLVQDLYVNFVRSQANVDEQDPDRLRGYLYRALKNLFLRKHRGNRDIVSNLAISDFDSIQIALSSVDGSQLLLVRSRLSQICDYACERRQTHKAGSVLILRFFFNYYPSEIAQVLKTTRATVDKLTHLARSEAKASLKGTGSLYFMPQHGSPDGKESAPKQSQATHSQKTNLPDDPTELKTELRERILSETQGVCFSAEEIARRYDQASVQTLTTSELAHFVSCRTCLDMVNETLRIPSLDMHFSSDDEHDDQDPPTAGTRREQKRARLRRKEREAFEHRPSQLQVAVNGYVLGSSAVSGEFNEFELTNLDLVTRPESVEVFSEQGISLIYLDLLASEFEAGDVHGAHVQLSDGRDLSVDMTWSGGSPGINVTYHDLPPEDSAEGLLHETIPTPPEAESKASAETPHEELKAGYWKRLTSWLLNRNWPLALPATVATGVLLGLGVFCYYHQKTKTVLPLATTLLHDSSALEEGAIPAHGAVHRVFSFEVRSDEGKTLESGTVDSLRGRAPGRRALRLLDQNSKLVAGLWVNEAGKTKDYSRRSNGTHATSRASDNIEALWVHIPEADDFEALVINPSHLTVEEGGGNYELTYTNPAETDAPTVVSASLILTADSKRPISETFRVQDHHKTHVYRFKELKYEFVRPSPQLESDFLVPTEAVNTSAMGLGMAGAIHSGSHLTLEALLLLSNLGPDVERIVDVERTPEGGTSINGVFETATEKTAVEHVFAPLRTGQDLKLDLHADDEPQASNAPHKQVVAQSVEAIAVDEQRIPLDADLRAALSSSGVSDADLDGRIHEIADRALKHCSQAHREAWTISQISAADFTAGELRVMRPEDRMLWLTLLDKHLRSFDQEMSSLGDDLAPVLKAANSRLPAPENHAMTVQTVEELRNATTTLNQNSDRLDRLLTAALTLSPNNIPATLNTETVAQLIATLRIRESMLHETVERLQASGQADRIE